MSLYLIASFKFPPTEVIDWIALGTEVFALFAKQCFHLVASWNNSSQSHQWYITVTRWKWCHCCLKFYQLNKVRPNPQAIKPGNLH
jgi:hypothetical protein